MGRISFFFFLFSFFFSLSFTQTPKQWANLGDDAAKDNDFYGASLYYKKAISFDSTNLSLIYKYSESLRKYNEYALAEKYYQKIFDADKGEKFPEALFWLATMQKFNGDYDIAKNNFRKFGKSYKDKQSYYVKKAKQEVKSCEFAKIFIQDSIPIRIRNAGESLNTEHSEFSAVLANDSTLYFSSLRSENITANNELSDKEYRMKIYSAKISDGIWKTEKEIDSIINISSFHSVNGTFSKDKTRFYFSRCAKNLKCSIYISELKNNEWQPAVKLENGINAEDYSSTQPMLSEIDGEEILFFVSDMPGGKGKLDIWTINLSGIKKGKKIVKPKNLSKINTVDNDISPFYISEDSILYFSSEWHYGLGGFDIFKSKENQKNFETPENIGYPYNTSTNDFYYSFYPKLKKGFITSNRKGSHSKKGETCCNDIYEFDFLVEEIEEKKDTEIVAETKYTSLEMLNKYLPVTLYFHNDEPNPRSWDTLTKINYMKTYSDYSAMMNTYKKEYSKGLSENEKEKAMDDIEKFFFDYAEKGVNDLELFSELLLKELEKGQKIELTVKGYASPLAKTDYNVNLTLRRISSMENFLKETPEGMYLPYLNKTALNGGSLDIVKIPFGEYKSDTTVSDNLNDVRNSVYSRKAMLERKIEIISVTQADKDSIYPEITFTEEIFDFGTIKQGEKLSHIFKFKNTGKENLKITNVNSSCGCTVAKWTRNELFPEGEGEIDVVFDTEGKSGKHVKTITIETNAVPSTKVIHVTAEIIE